jgi:outer membrane protein OmpA-like peptidoglycan-associated protein
VSLRPFRLLMLSIALAVGLGSASPAYAQDLEFGYRPAPEPGEQPAFIVQPTRNVAELTVVVTAGGEEFRFDGGSVGSGVQKTFAWKRDTRVTTAEAYVKAVFDDGFVSEVTIPMEYTYGGQLEVDLSRASADVKKQIVTVQVSHAVDRAEITVYGARKAVLGKREVEIGAGPGEIDVPWVGDPGDVVLLDVTLHSGNAWAGFTYSPWFLDIPHEDVLFESNSADVPEIENFKLEHTLRELQGVLDKYGSVVPVKLYIAGCTDTVGDASHNRDLSRRRAKAIAAWLRSHGYDKAIYYHGFGESLLAVPTGDGVNEGRNRRALYMVGANPPPASSGIPRVTWTEL